MDKTKIQKKQKLINYIVVVFVLFLIFYSVVQLTSGMSSSLTTLRTQDVTDRDHVTLKGYIFRDEELVITDNPVIVDYLALDGEKLGVGDTFAKYYTPNTEIPAPQKEQIQTEINKLTDTINILENSLSGDGSAQDIEQIREMLDMSYYSYISALNSQDYNLADYYGNLMLGGMNDFLVATGELEQTSSVLNTLKQTKADIIAGVSTKEPTNMTNDVGCYFYSDVDGYENVFDYSGVMDMSAAEFSSIISTQKNETNTDVIGKYVYSARWYMALPADATVCQTFAEEIGREYEVEFSDQDGMVINMRLERVVLPELEGQDGFILMSSMDMPNGFDFSRSGNVRILTNSYSGYRVPIDALVQHEGEDGVYVLVGNVVEFRRVTIIAKRDEYYIVNTYRDDELEESLSSLPYLLSNELIITSGGNLYDGKILD